MGPNITGENVKFSHLHYVELVREIFPWRPKSPTFHHSLVKNSRLIIQSTPDYIVIDGKCLSPNREDNLLLRLCLSEARVGQSEENTFGSRKEEKVTCNPNHFLWNKHFVTCMGLSSFESDSCCVITIALPRNESKEPELTHSKFCA